MRTEKPHRVRRARIPGTVFYPVFLNVSGRKAVVIGGGKVAERKIQPLLKSGARVTVISPTITKKIEDWKGQRRVKHIARSYRKGDARDAFVVIAATDSAAVNERVSGDAPCLVNVVDTPLLCNFIVPSTMVRGPLNIAVSTSGVSPAFAGSVRRELEKNYGREFACYLRSLGRIRQEALAMIQDKRKRTAFLKCIASEAAIKRVRRDGSKKMQVRAEDLLNRVRKT